MAQIGTIRLETQNNGTVSIPIFEIGDSGSNTYEFLRVQTTSGPGFLPAVDPADASFPYIRVQSQNQGVVALNNESNLFSYPEAAGSLVAWYPFDPNSGAIDQTAGDSTYGDSTDYSGTVNGATYDSNGGVTDINHGTNSGAYLYDGSGDEIVDIGTIYDDDRTFTINVWFSTDDTSTVQSIVNNYTGGKEQCTIRTTSSGGVSWYNRDSGSDGVNITGGNVNSNTWYMFTGVRDGGTIRFYLDTNQINSGTDNNMDRTVGSQNFHIGNQPHSDQAFDGHLDDVRFYNKVLSDTEISNIYNNTQP